MQPNVVQLKLMLDKALELPPARKPPPPRPDRFIVHQAPVSLRYRNDSAATAVPVVGRGSYTWKLVPEFVSPTSDNHDQYTDDDQGNINHGADLLPVVNIEEITFGLDATSASNSSKAALVSCLASDSEAVHSMIRLKFSIGAKAPMAGFFREGITNVVTTDGRSMSLGVGIYDGFIKVVSVSCQTRDRQLSGGSAAASATVNVKVFTAEMLAIPECLPHIFREAGFSGERIWEIQLPAMLAGQVCN